MKQQRIEARDARSSRAARGGRTPPKNFLVGAIVLAKVEQGVLEDSVLRGWLDAALSREDDRALFGLTEPRASGPPSPL